MSDPVPDRQALTARPTLGLAGRRWSLGCCLGRQRLKNGCTFIAIQADHLEDLVERHWSTVTLSDERVSAIRDLVLEHAETLLPKQTQAQTEAEQLVADLQRQSGRLLNAYYADAIDVEHLKREQARIAAARGSAEAEIQRNATNEDVIVEKLGYLCTLLRNAQGYYSAATEPVKRDLNQGLFERIYVQDDEVVGSDFAEPYQRLLGDNLAGDLLSERKRDQNHHVRTRDLYVVPEVGSRRDRGERTPVGDLPSQARRGAPESRLSAFLGLERPRGALPWKARTPDP